jgi:hypothetical protein
MILPIAEHEYHIVELNHRDGEVLAWCLERFGEPSIKRWFWKPNKIHFYNPQDHLMFLLMWGSQ